MHDAFKRFSPLLCFSLLFWQCDAAETDYTSAIQQLKAAAQSEIQSGAISGVSIALVDDQEIVFADGSGFADKRRQTPARRETVYRAGSISKLFTALATMQLVEQGKLDIDQPVSRYDPDFKIIVPFANAKPITLRQLMCHRAGMIRESPVGSYFDPTEPGTARTVASLASCALVYPPDTKTKYSNSGVTVVGHVVEKVSGLSFENYQKQHLLGPIGMLSSAFLPDQAIRSRLAKGYLPVANASGGFREIEAPHFEFGIFPAGNLYTTAEDLGRFLSFLFARGTAGTQRVIPTETLDEMFTPQLTKATNGFGLGFSMGNFRGHKTFGHSGAVYGFTSSLVGIPDCKIGAVILCNDDIVTGPMRKLNTLALGLMLQAKLGETNPPPALPIHLTPEELAAFTGNFESESFWAELKVQNGSLQANISNQRMTLTPVAPLRFAATGRVVDEAPVAFERNDTGELSAFSALGQRFQRIASGKHDEIPLAWKKFLGSYGPRFIPFIVSWKHGHLYGMTENEYDYRLTPINQSVFNMPPGLYTDEHVVFQSDSRGKVHSAVLANMKLARQR